MSRDISAGLDTELTNFNIKPVTMVRLDWHTKDDEDNWDPTPIYLNNTGQNITHDGNVYQGIGSLGSISGVEEGLELQEYSATLSLSGIPTESVSSAFSDISFANGYTNRPAYIYIGFLDDDYQIIDDPILIFSGQMDSANIEIGETVTIQLVVQSRLVNWEIPRGGRFNKETQASLYPDDTSFNYMDKLENAEIRFPGGVSGI